MFVVNKLPFLLLIAAIASPPTEACGFGASLDVWSFIQMFEDLTEVRTAFCEEFIIGLEHLPTVGWVIIVAAISYFFLVAFMLMGCLDKTDSVKKVAGQFGKAKRDTNISNIQDRGDDMV